MVEKGPDRFTNEGYPKRVRYRVVVVTEMNCITCIEFKENVKLE